MLCYTACPFHTQREAHGQGQVWPACGEAAWEGVWGVGAWGGAGLVAQSAFSQLLGLFNLAQLASRNIPQGAPGKGLG